MIKYANIAEAFRVFQRRRPRYKLFYWSGEKNAGDVFNQDIMDYFGISYEKKKYMAATLLGLGSIRNALLSRKLLIAANGYGTLP